MKMFYHTQGEIIYLPINNKIGGISPIHQSKHLLNFSPYEQENIGKLPFI